MDVKMESDEQMKGRRTGQEREKGRRGVMRENGKDRKAKRKGEDTEGMKEAKEDRENKEGMGEGYVLNKYNFTNEHLQFIPMPCNTNTSSLIVLLSTK